MTNVLVLGAAGKIARHATRQFLDDSDAALTLYLRRAERLREQEGERVRVVEGDVRDTDLLRDTARGHDVVYANLAGRDIEQQAESVVRALGEAAVPRLIWVSTLGIYDEVPGPFGRWNHEMLDGGYLETYAAAAAAIEASDLAYTIIRPAWLTDKDEVDYELTHRADPFKGTEVSRRSVGDLVVKLAADPERAIHDSLGMNKPNTDAAKPAWY